MFNISLTMLHKELHMYKLSCNFIYTYSIDDIFLIAITINF